jgi:hypothetical protein
MKRKDKSEFDKPIKGICSICKVEYNQTIFEYSELRRVYISYNQNCPRCNYNPDLKEKISEILRGIKITEGSKGLEFNTSELYHSILNEIEKSWYKPKQKGGKK